MGFYDSVKDDVRDEHRPDDETTEGDDTEEREMPFDQLKKDAEEYDETEEEQEDDSGDAGIEVLTPDGAEPAGGQAGDASAEPAQQTREQRPDGSGADGPARSQQEPTSSSADTSPAREPAAADDADGSEVLDALERLEAQNDEMIDLLRGIKRSLDR